MQDLKLTAMLTAKKIYRFYAEGFKQMTVGKKLWLIIIIKLIILFLILKVFFFPDFIKSHTPDDGDGSDVVRSEILGRSSSH